MNKDYSNDIPKKEKNNIETPKKKSFWKKFKKMSKLGITLIINTPKILEILNEIKDNIF